MRPWLVATWFGQDGSMHKSTVYCVSMDISAAYIFSIYHRRLIHIPCSLAFWIWIRMQLSECKPYNFRKKHVPSVRYWRTMNLAAWSWSRLGSLIWRWKASLHSDSSAIQCGSSDIQTVARISLADAPCIIHCVVTWLLGSVRVNYNELAIFVRFNKTWLTIFQLDWINSKAHKKC